MPAQSQKIAIVTGANNGIGFETAIGMAEAGWHVVMACRSQDKAEKAKAMIVKRLPAARLTSCWSISATLPPFAPSPATSVHAISQLDV